MRIDVVAPLELAEADMAAWSAIQSACPELDSPFLSPAWPRALARADGPDARRGRIAVMRNEAGAAQGFLHARVGRFTALPMGAPMSDYHALVAAPDLRVDPRQLARALGVRRIDLQNFVPRPDFAPHLHAASESLIADLSDGYDAYAKERRAAGSDILQDCAKKKRKLEREHGPVTFAPLSRSPESFDALVAWKRAQYRATRQTDIFDSGWPLDVLRQAFEAPQGDFAAGLFTLSVGGKMIAANLSVLGRGVVHAWFISHDDAFQKYSPGVLLFAEILRWAPENGYRELDLGPGDYRFKLSLGSTRRAVAHGYVGRPSCASAIRGAEYGVRGMAERLPLGRMSQLPGKAMRRIDTWRSLRAT